MSKTYLFAASVRNQTPQTFEVPADSFAEAALSALPFINSLPQYSLAFHDVNPNSILIKVSKSFQYWDIRIEQLKKLTELNDEQALAFLNNAQKPCFQPL